MPAVIQSQISATDLTLKPGLSVATLDVEVVNTSDRHASFYIVLSATGEKEEISDPWYSLLPITSSKVPPGTRSTYTVSISDTPLPGFVGLINVTVRIISPELGSEERHVLRLLVEPSLDAIAFEVELPTQTFQDYPGQLVEIPARVYNHHRNPIAVRLSYPGIDSWLDDHHLETLTLMPNRWHNIVIPCQIPEDIELSRSQVYLFQILVADENGKTAAAVGSLEVLPIGYFDVAVADTQLQLPSPRPYPQQWFPNRKLNTTQTQIQLENHSNLNSTLQLAVPFSENEVLADESSESENTESTASSQVPYEVDFSPSSVLLNAGESNTVEATIQADRPWLGWVRTLLVPVQTQLEDARLELRHDHTTLQVKVSPIIPVWLQCVGAFFCAGMLGSLFLVNVYRQTHHQPVNSVQFNGVGDRVVSGASDQTIRQWQVRRWGIRSVGKPIELDKAARVVRYRPVDNNQLMVGLENGEIQIWDLLQSARQPVQTFVNQTGKQSELDDRVMDLAITADSRHLLSGYGSGLVSLWPVGPQVTPRSGSQASASPASAQASAQEILIPEMAIYGVALVGGEEQRLAIAGRYNKLKLWNRFSNAPSNALSAIDYPPGGQDDYITSLSSPERKPYRLATADNQGHIKLWNLEDCLDQAGQCTVIDQWQLPDSAAVSEVAFSDDGCYLVSASSDGQIQLWPLTAKGQRLTKHLEGKLVKKLDDRFNAVDIKVLGSRILIASGADDHRVRVHRVKATNQICATQ